MYTKISHLSAAVGTMLRSDQDRKNLEADPAAIDSWLQTGVTNFRYRGITMGFELFADESQKETERLAVSHLWNSNIRQATPWTPEPNFNAFALLITRLTDH